MVELTPELLLHAYAVGIFPMAERRDDPELYWVDPELRGILPLDGFHLPRRLAPHRAPRDRSRSAPIAPSATSCAPAPSRAPTDRKTWINDRDRAALHRAASSAATRIASRAGGTASWSAASTACRIGGAFFGESMFSRERRRQQGRAGPSRGAAERRRLHACSTPSS